MKVFLDIGAHHGETLSVVQDRVWQFDRIVCFEPASICWPTIRAAADSRVELCEFGLWHKDDVLELNNPGEIGASMSPDKDGARSVERCDFKDAATWFATHLEPHDEVYAKINAEGAEADIIARLFDAGELSKIDHLLVHFDVRKVPSLRSREPELTRQLSQSGIEWHAAEDIQFGGVYRGTRNWLRWCHAGHRTRDLRFKVINRFIFALRRKAYPLKVAVLSRRGRSDHTTRNSSVGT